MTKLFSALTGTDNLLTNIIASVMVTIVLCLILAFAGMALTNGINDF